MRQKTFYYALVAVGCLFGATYAVITGEVHPPAKRVIAATERPFAFWGFVVLAYGIGIRSACKVVNRFREGDRDKSKEPRE